MLKPLRAVRQVGALLFLAAALGGCQALEREQAAQTERVLAQAGFQVIHAESEAGRAELAALPPHRVVERSEAGKTVYAYADAELCGCLYVGGAEAYRKFGELEEREALIRSWSAPDL